MGLYLQLFNSSAVLGLAIILWTIHNTMYMQVLRSYFGMAFHDLNILCFA